MGLSLTGPDALLKHTGGGLETVVDLGAGRGELLTHLHHQHGERFQLVGVEVAPRPATCTRRSSGAGSCHVVHNRIVGWYRGAPCPRSLTARPPQERRNRGSMAVGERERRELQEALMEAIGPEQTDTLLGYLPPVGWADVATTRDLQTLDASLRGELRGEIGELRGEIGELRGEIGRLSGRVDHQLRVQLYWLVSLILVLVGVQVSFGVAILTTR